MPRAAHGGILATLLDETLSYLIFRNLELERPSGGGSISGSVDANVGGIVTASLNTRFLKPLDTPATVLVRARLLDRVGRKWRTEASVEGGDGTVFARAESLWIELRERRRPRL